MSHGALICRECFSEIRLHAGESESELVCPDCGGTDFSI